MQSSSGVSCGAQTWVMTPQEACTLRKLTKFHTFLSGYKSDQFTPAVQNLLAHDFLAACDCNMATMKEIMQLVKSPSIDIYAAIMDDLYSSSTPKEFVFIAFEKIKQALLFPELLCAVATYIKTKQDASSYSTPTVHGNEDIIQQISARNRLLEQQNSDLLKQVKAQSAQVEALQERVSMLEGVDARLTARISSLISENRSLQRELEAARSRPSIGTNDWGATGTEARRKELAADICQSWTTVACFTEVRGLINQVTAKKQPGWDIGNFGTAFVEECFYFGVSKATMYKALDKAGLKNFADKYFG